MPFREILLLCEVEEMSYQEIAETLAIPMGTVMSRLFRARKALRDLLRKKNRGRPAWHVSNGATNSMRMPTANSIRAEANALAMHLPGCAACAADVLGRVQMKRSVQMAGKRYTASANFGIGSRRTSPPSRAGKPAGYGRFCVIPALAVLILSVAVNLYVERESARRQRRVQRTG